MDRHEPRSERHLSRRTVLGATLATAALSCRAAAARQSSPAPQSAATGSAPKLAKNRPTLVGSMNALAGMQQHYQKLVDGGDPLDVAIEVVKVTEADPLDDSVGLGGLPNEDGVVQLDAACMYGPRHKSGAVACIENILHPSEVARLVLERTDHVLLVGKGAYEFARKHGHPHVELLTEASRKKWLDWKEGLSTKDDWLPPPPKLPFDANAAPGPVKIGAVEPRVRDWKNRVTGTIHCSALAASGAVACTTTTSGLAWKIAGRVGDSAIIGAGLYCDQASGSAGSTGRGEANILANGSFLLVELLRRGVAPIDAGMELLRRVTAQTQRQGRYQPELLDDKGLPAFGLKFYILGIDGAWAGLSLRDAGQFAVADPEHGPRLEPLHVLHS